MTKAMRWGVSALMILGGVSLGAFAGCSSDDDKPPPTTDTTDTGTGNPDTGTAGETGDMDTGTMEETGGDTGDASDAPAFKADRGASIVFASPDNSNKFLCFGAFAGDPAAAAKPLQALGPFGVEDMGTLKPIPYGAASPVPLTSAAVTALNALTTAIYMIDGPTAPADCAAAWEGVKGDTTRWKSFAPKAINAGEHGIIVFRGCKDPAATNPECGGKAFEIVLEKADTTAPTMFAGGGTGAKVGLQFFNWSGYAGVPTAGAPPSLQGVDVYVMPMVAAGGGDAGADGGDGGGTKMPGTPVKIATNVKWGEKAMNAVGVQIQGDPMDAFLVLTPTGEAPDCSYGVMPPGSPTCTKTWLPLKDVLTTFAPLGGGFVDGTNQFVGISGALLPKTSDPLGRTMRIPMGRLFTK